MLWKKYQNIDSFKFFSSIKDKPYAFSLESLNNAEYGRYSFFGSDPFLIFKAKEDKIEISGYRQSNVIANNPLVVLRELINEFTRDSSSNIPFTSGGVGYFSYDFGLYLQNKKSALKDNFDVWDIVFCFYSVIFVYDHLEKYFYIFSSGLPETDKNKNICKAKDELDVYEKLLYTDKIIGSVPGFDLSFLSLDMTFDIYSQKLHRIKEHIREGDIYQVNFSNRFSFESDIDAFSLYKKIRDINPTDFSGYFDLGKYQIISNSPEQFARLDHKRHIITRPMKGTRARGLDNFEDKALYNDLCSHDKDSSELLMIVDLERNDLGKICRPFTINVNKFKDIEKYNTVYQATAEIEGYLKQEYDALSVIEALFPGGSITGAPKLRAMEIIDELEIYRRNIYTGILGYLDFSGSMDFNILIRTLLKYEDKFCFNVGGGILYDSDIKQEYLETLTKAQSILKALGKDKKEFSFCK